MSTAPTPVYEWNDLPWKAIEKRVFKLQKRIYQASQRGDTKTVHKLQRLLMRSWSAKCLAVRTVTQDNRGKRTAGVDGVRALPPCQRTTLVPALRPGEKAPPVRRIWIPKPGTTEQRPLGIPTIQVRAEQSLVKLALEPQWEARFEPNSYGFRPGRSCHDAIDAIFASISTTPKYVLDADIAKCFDHINHQALLNKLATFPTLRRIIRAWLQAGVLDDTKLLSTTEGTPQGGPLSPLLANIALHGLETAITSAFPTQRRVNGRFQRWRPTVIRYADDFVILHSDRSVIEHCKQLASEWLHDMGLELKPSKTTISHTLSRHEGHVGFDFLGFTIRQYPVGKTHSGKRAGGRRPTTLLGFTTRITPSKEAQRRHLLAIKTLIRDGRAISQATLIHRLNPLIRGWTGYYASQVSKAVFSRMAYLTTHKLYRWARRRHPGRSWNWVRQKYWRDDQKRWDFATAEGERLYQHADTPIRRHTKVKGAKSPYDGDWVYWTTRMGTHPDAPPRIASLLRKQHGRCSWCGLYLKDGDLPETDHILPTSRGGSRQSHNWQLIHRHCHDTKTVGDGSLAGRGAHDRGQSVEEPDEVNVSCPVLKTSRVGDCSA